MRDIRFRAWDAERGKMIAVEKMTFAESVQWSNCAVCGFHVGPAARDYPLMQFTGLKDRSNLLTEVYEGDIVDENGVVKGNIYESPQVYRPGIDHIIATMGTKTWRESESIAMGRGCVYAE